MRSRLSFLPLLVAVLAIASACVFGGGDDDDSSSDPGTIVATPTPFTNDDSISPHLEGPASLYSISQDDLGPGYITDIEGTWVLSSDVYGGTKPFAGTDGPGMLKGWGYVDGYETGYTPEGRSAAVLNGSYTIKVETHLMKDEAGARELFNFFKEALGKSVSEPVSASPIGNEFTAWRYIDRENGVNGSDIPGEYHQYVFRRGNLVAAVLTWGAEPFANVNAVYSLAHIIDEKALGQVPLVEPTPVATPVATAAGN